MTGPQSPFPDNDPFSSPQGFVPSQTPPVFGGGPPFPPPGPPPPPPRRDRTQFWIAGTAGAAIVVLLLAAAVVKLTSQRTAEHGQATTSAATAAPPAASAPTSPSATAPPTPSTTAPAGTTCQDRVAGPGPNTPAGWSPVVSPRGLIYDVPPGWTVNSCTTLIGWEKKCPNGPFGSCPIRTMSGSADLPNSSCKSQDLAMTGVPGDKDISDIHQAARIEANLATEIYTSDSGAAPTVSQSQEMPLTVGGSAAVEVLATVTDITPNGCGATSALHVVVATTVPGQPGTVLFVASLPQGLPGSAGPQVADQLVKSLRRAN